MDPGLYPRMVVSQGSMIPYVNLPTDYRERAAGLDERVVGELETLAETTAQAEESVTGRPEIRLVWDDEIPTLLRRVQLGPSIGYDLEESGIPHYTSHNLDGEMAIMAFVIAQRYWFELMNI